jgi:alkylation response protein AidB-like acyl-CoA dehydrogenase
MDFEFSDEYKTLRETCRRIAREKVAPRAREIDESEEFPHDIFDVFKQAGLLGLAIPQEYGGSGAGCLGLVIAIEEVAKYCNSSALILLLSRLPTSPLLIAGSEEQKKKYVAPVASGERKGAFALSEPQAGSWVMGIETRASRVGGRWVLNGRKCWMSGATVADFYVVFAKTDPSAGHEGFTAFVVDRDLPGVSIGTIDRKLGVRGVPTAEVIFDAVELSDDAVVGTVGGGFKLAMLSLNSMRPIVAARGLGLAEGALMYATKYVEERPAFGSRIADFQGIQWTIADLAVQIEAARLLTYRAARLVDSGKFDKAHAPYLSMAKYFATEVAVRAANECLQMMGAAGYMKDHPMELYYRDARQLTIVEGTSQIQKNLIARGVLARDLWWD